MRWLVITLAVIFIVLQYKLWFDDGGVRQVHNLRQQISTQKIQNAELQKQNDRLRAEVKDLKQGSDAPEEKARTELGMVKQNEEYFQVVQEKPNKS